MSEYGDPPSQPLPPDPPGGGSPPPAGPPGGGYPAGPPGGGYPSGPPGGGYPSGPSGPPGGGYASGPPGGGYPPGPPGPPGGGYPPGPDYRPGPPSPPPNYLVWAILTTICCCPPLGIVSIVFAAQVNSKWAVGDVAGAQASSRKAKTWAIWSAVAAVVADVLIFLLWGGLIAARN